MLFAVLVVSCCGDSQKTVLPACFLRGGAGGGGWALFKRRDSPSERYRKELEDQVAALDRQLRTSREEAMRLRKLVKLTSDSKRKATVAEWKTTKSNQQSLHKELSLLQQQIQQMEQFREELEKLLEVAHARIKELEQLLEKESAKAVQLQKQHELEMQELRKSLVAKAQKQLEEINRLMEQRIREATEAARREALSEVDQTVADATQKVQRQADRVLEKERRLSQEAVEKERVKMRKLVKALAEREKSLFAKHHAAEQRQSQAQSVKKNNSRRQQQAPIKTPNIRSPVK